MRVSRFLMSFAAAAAVVTMLPQAPPEAAPPATTKTVVLDCAPGWQSGAGGQYGGVGFQLSCRNGRSQQRLTGFTSTDYTIRMGVESSSTGADCFWSGSAETVSENCGDVRISVR